MYFALEGIPPLHLHKFKYFIIEPNSDSLGSDKYECRSGSGSEFVFGTSAHFIIPFLYTSPAHADLSPHSSYLAILA